MYKSISTKLLIAFFLVSVGPALLLSMISYQANREALEEQTSAGVKALSNERARNIAHIIRLKQERGMEIAGSSAVRQLKQDGINDFFTIKKIQDEIEWTYYESKLKSLNLDTDKDSISESIDICDAEGVVIASSNKNSIDDLMPSEYAEAARESGSHFIGAIEDPRTHELLLTFLEKIRDLETEEFAGFVVLKVNIEILNEIVTASAGLGKTEEGYVIDKNFSILTRLKNEKEVSKTLKDPPQAIVSCFQKKEQTAIYKNYAETTVLGTTKYLPDQGWCLVHEVELTEAFAPVDKLRRRIIFLSSILVLGILGLAFLTSRSLSRPILAVRNAALQIAKGNTDVRARISSKDEIGELARAFNQMTDQIVKSQNELARSNQDLEEFSYVASHDLQEPLRKIASYGEALQEDYSERLGEEGQQFIKTMQKAAERMMQLIQALLEYSRVTRKVHPPESVPLESLIGEVLSDLETAIQKSGGAVEVGSLPTIQADPIQMRQLFQNLIGNALKFSRKGVPPHVSIQGQVLDSREVEIKVSDNGIGFDKKFGQKVFQPFQRLVTRDQYQGTGIGLSVCKKIVERHHGTISVTSESDKGTTFTIRLPMA